MDDGRKLHVNWTLTKFSAIILHSLPTNTHTIHTTRTCPKKQNTQIAIKKEREGKQSTIIYKKKPAPLNWMQVCRCEAFYTLSSVTINNNTLLWGLFMFLQIEIYGLKMGTCLKSHSNHSYFLSNQRLCMSEIRHPLQSALLKASEWYSTWTLVAVWCKHLCNIRETNEARMNRVMERVLLFMKEKTIFNIEYKW